MSVNGITNATTNTYAPTTDTKAKTTETKQKDTAADVGVVYEPSTNATDSKSNKTTDYSSIIKQLNSDLATRNQQLQNLVTKLLGEQANKYTSLAEMYKNMVVDPETVAQAQKDISEDGYWGVEQTSERLFSMAKALSGGDPSKADTLIAAMKKGFEQATKAWGDDLPDICSKTIDAAVSKMESWRDGLSTEE